MVKLGGYEVKSVLHEQSKRLSSGAFFPGELKRRASPTLRPVEFGKALAAGTRLTPFSADKPDRFFTVIKFWMDATSGVALDLKTGVPCYQVEDEEGRIHLLIHCQSSKRRKTGGAPGGRTRSILIPGPFLRVRWLRSREVGVMEQWSLGVVDYRAFGSYL